MRSRLLTLLSSPLLSLLWLADAIAQTAPATAVPAPSASLGGSFLQMLFGLAIVLALLFAGLWLLKKLTGGVAGRNSLVNIVGSTPIGARERIVIVELGQTWLVLGVTPNSINTLAEMPRQTLPPGITPTTPNFAGWLRESMNRRNAR